MTTQVIIAFYPLTFVPDGEEIIVGRPDINSFAAFPPDGAALLKQMQAGMPPHMASQWYQDQYHEPIDIDDFLSTLHEMQFIRTGGESGLTSAQPGLARWQTVGKCVFSPVAWILYALVCGYSLYVMVTLPYLRPMNSHVFFSPSYTIIELALFLGQLPCIFFHESFHVLAGKRLGLSSRLGIGRRLYFIVFETDLTGLWSVPKQARYLPFLAGMVGDVLLFSLFTIVASFTYTPDHPYALPGAFCLALAYLTVLRFVWQFYFYLQTDIYYVLTAATGCVNLQQITRHYVFNRLYRLFGRAEKCVDETRWPPRDHQIAPWYAPLYVVGHLVSIGVLVFAALPIAYRYLSGVAIRLLTSKALSAEFWDVCIFLALNTLQLIVIGVLLWRERQQKVRLKQAQEQQKA